jgi:hypothetical protein
MATRLRLIPVTITQAKAFVAEHHRHHGPPVSGLFAVGVCNEQQKPVGIAIVGRPVARMLQHGLTAEVTRLCALEAANVCSLLYAACWRATRALGHRRLVTYILSEEPGTSLRASGWRLIAKTRGGTWGRAGRPRDGKHPMGPKQRWEARPDLPEWAATAVSLRTAQDVERGEIHRETH